MVEIGKLYSFSAREIECIESSNIAGNGRYRLTIHMKSGKSYSVDYANESARDTAHAGVIRQFDRDILEVEQKMLNRLYLIQSIVERTDKRQLRIWRQLKLLLGVKTEDDGDG